MDNFVNSPDGKTVFFRKIIVSFLIPSWKPTQNVVNLIYNLMLSTYVLTNPNLYNKQSFGSFVLDCRKTNNTNA